MMRKMSKILSLVLAIVMMFLITIVGSYATEEYGAELDRGYIGEDPINYTSEWILYEDGTLVIKGEGFVYWYHISDDTGILSDLPTIEQRNSVKKIIIEEGIVEIDGLMDFPNLVEVVWPDSLTCLWEDTLCDSVLLDVYIPASLVRIGRGSFQCVKNITVHEENPNYSSDEYGVLFNKDKTELITFPSNSDMTEYTVPDGVVKIHNTAQVCANLAEITFPESLREISNGAFEMSGSLKTVNFSEGLEKIGERAFYFCFSLEKVEFPTSLKSLGEQCFADCLSLNEIIVKNPEIEIAENGFGLINAAPAEGVSTEKWLEILAAAFTIESTDEDRVLVEQNTTFYSSPVANERAVVYIHDIEEENNAEAYAQQYGIKVERTHFYGEWEYDWENYLRIRKCELCEMTETEALEKVTEDDVEIIAPENPELNFDVDSIDKGNDTFVFVEQQVKGNTSVENEVLKVFDITLKNSDGVHVQPDGTVKVKLPLDWEKDGIYRVYRVNDDGTLTDMNAYRQGSHMVFEADHFSIYVIVEEASAEEKAEEEKTDILAFFRNALNTLINIIKMLIEFVCKS